MRFRLVKAQFVLGLSLFFVIQDRCLAQHMNAKDAPCEGPSAAVDEAECFGIALKKADTELNAYYRRIDAVETGRDRTNLKIAQKLWIQFRDANCKAEYELYEGGSAGPVVEAACREAMTRHRKQELEEMYGWRLEKFGK